MLGRRSLIVGLAALPASPLLLPGCAPRPPETPLAHLYGEQWVHGAYELYAGGYQGVQSGAEAQSFETYRVLAQKGVVALDGLQARGVPFYVRVDGGEKGFVVERRVPERLTFTADMTEQQRAEATASFERAREHLHTDYEEVRRLDTSLTTLLRQLQRVRNAIEQGREEQYRLVRKLDALAQGGPAPFALPYQVTPKDYEGVLVLLLERLEDDRARLSAIEASIVTVGLTARSTDAGSGSLSSNLNQVLLAVARDAEASKPRPKDFPKAEGERAELSSRGTAIRDRIRGSEEYKAWLRREQDKELEQVGALLSVLDRMTGLPASSIYKQVMQIWRGDADYLSYLKTAASLVPGGSYVAKVIGQAVEVTDKARQAADLLEKASSPEAIAELAKKKGLGVLNTQTRYGVDRISRQLVFFKAPKEAEEASKALTETRLLAGS